MGIWSKGSNSSSQKLLKEFDSKIEKFQRELVVSENYQHEFDKIAKITNTIFSKLFDIHYKFTYEDVKHEASEKLPSTIQAVVTRVCDEMHDLEFDKSRVNKDTLWSVSDNLLALLRSAASVDQSKLIPDIESSDFEFKEPEPITESNLEIPKIPDMTLPPPDDLNEPPKMPDTPKKGLFSKIFKRKKQDTDDEFRPPEHEMTSITDFMANKGLGDDVTEPGPMEDILLHKDNTEEPQTDTGESFTVGQASTKEKVVEPSIPKVPLPPKKIRKTISKPHKIKKVRKKPKLMQKRQPAPKVVKKLKPKTIKKPAAQVPVVKKIPTKVTVPKTQLNKVAVKKVKLKKAVAKKPKIKKLLKKKSVRLKHKPVKKSPHKIIAKSKIKKVVQPKTKSVKPNIVIKKQKIPKKLKTVSETLTKLIAQTEAAPKKELPKFEIPSKLIKREIDFKKDLVELVKDLERGKEVVTDELHLIDQKTRLLKDEKKLADKKIDRHGPVFDDFKRNIDSELKKLETMKAELQKREKSLSSRLKAVSIMEKNLREMSDRLFEDEKVIKQKDKFIKTKEKIIHGIKKQLDKKYNKASKEIDKIRQDLKEKSENFLKLQKFYMLRENKLAVEEANLLNEKREYSKLVSNLLSKHVDIVYQDLANIENHFKTLKEKEERIQEGINKYEKSQKRLEKDKLWLAKDISAKKEYFNKVRDEFLNKDTEFDSVNKLLTEKTKNLLERQSSLSKYLIELEKLDGETTSRSRSFELKEVDLNNLEKEVNRIAFNLKNKNMRLEWRERQLDKRKNSADRLRKRILRNIRREQSEVNSLKHRLKSMGYYVNAKDDLLENYDQGYDQLKGFIFDRPLKQPSNMPMISEAKIGHPAMLDIIRLLNMAKEAISQDDSSRAKDIYYEVQRIFDDLDEEDKESIYGDIVKVFRTKTPVATNDNIDGLIDKFENSINRGDIDESQEIYSELQKKYAGLSQDDKNRYYPVIMQLYNRILDHQIGTGVMS